MKNLFTPMLAFLLALPPALQAQERATRIELEAGAVSTRNMEIRGFQQGNATQDWSQSAPALRLEYWRVKEDGWNYGLIAQPLSLRYDDTLKRNLSVKGRSFRSGDAAALTYEFPTVRLSANKRILSGEDGSYVRAGGSAVLRYAKVALSGSGQSFLDTNWIAIPLVNIEASRPVGGGYSLFTRSDFLPGIDGDVFLDGLYDIYFGVRRRLSPSEDLDVGVRLFFGGYDPKEAGDYANRIFFSSIVVRYSF